MLTPSFFDFTHKSLHPWKLRHAHIHTTTPLGYVRNLTFATPKTRIHRG